MADKSISSALRQFLQKNGDSLAGKRPGRDEMVKAVQKLANMGRGAVSRSWGDQFKDRDIKKR